MIDPISNYPQPLQEIIITFEEKGLDEACKKAKEFSSSLNEIIQKGLSAKPEDQGPWLWSCYFDAHWMSDSIGEWATLHKRLEDHLEMDPAWVIFHDVLLERLQEAYQKTFQIHELLKKEAPIPHFADFEWIEKRLKAVDPWMDSSLRKTFRIPIHKNLILPNPDHSLVFWEAACIHKCPSYKAPLSICSDLLSLCYAADLLESDTFFLPMNTPTILRPSVFERFEVLLRDYPIKILQDLWTASKKDDSLLNTFLVFSKNIQNRSREIKFDYYGPQSKAALLYRFQFFDWYEGLSWRDISPEKDPLNKETTKLYEEFSKINLEPLSVQKKLPRIVHITSQLVDQGHAPSNILYRLLTMSNKDALDQAVVVTETLSQKKGSYPYHLRHTTTSEIRGANFLKFLDKEKIAYLVERPDVDIAATESLEEMAIRLAKRLIHIDADAIVFHGCEPLYHALAALLKKPLKIIFEHGTLPKAPGFDLAICCLEDTPLVAGEKLKQLSTELFVLPFASDARWFWKNEMPKKEDFGISDNFRVATTISNHLSTRLNPAFCRAISEILKEIPDLVYAPIGKVENPQELLNRFSPEIHHRIKFLGAQQHPSQLTRAMDIYFNEFPFGSCYGILDAMASGCPVVSMYDLKGPPQGRYGGLFMGLDQSVQTGLSEDYVKKACEWLKSPLSYFKASQIAFQEYEWRSNYWAYVEQFEKCILEKIANRR